MVLDTGACKTWFPAYQICQGPVQTCPQGSCKFGSQSRFINPDAPRLKWLIIRDIVQSGVSTTTTNENLGGLVEKFIDGTSVRGNSFTDMLKIGASTIASAQLAVATRILPAAELSLVGNMGLSFDPESAEVETPYPSVIRHMMAQNIITIPTYSLWLNPSKLPSNLKHSPFS